MPISFSSKIVLLCLSIVSSVFSAELVSEVTLYAKVRDFLELTIPEPDTTMVADSTSDSESDSILVYDSIPEGYRHPDFEIPGWARPCKQVVANKLSYSGMNSSFKGDNRTPFYIGNEQCGYDQYEGSNHFNHWYNDNPPDTNRSYIIELVFGIYDDLTMRYKNRSFFPIDDGKPFTPANNPPLPTFGHNQKKQDVMWLPDSALLDHNFGFTMELHTNFKYHKGFGQKFIFEGDDDVWVFINDSLVIDLGGLHPPQQAVLDLDALPDGFMEDGEKCTFDLFFAERRSYGSNLIIESGLLFESEDILQGIFGNAKTREEKIAALKAHTAMKKQTKYSIR